MTPKLTVTTGILRSSDLQRMYPRVRLFRGADRDLELVTQLRYLRYCKSNCKTRGCRVK